MMSEAITSDRVGSMTGYVHRLGDNVDTDAMLPGRYLARDAHGENPGSGYVRIALVPSQAECVDAARRIVEFAHG